MTVPFLTAPQGSIVPIPVQCPGCGAKLRAPDAAVGKSLKCPACAAVVPVPASSAAPKRSDAPASAPQTLRDYEPDGAVAPRRGVPVWVWIVGTAGVALTGVVGIALVIYLAMPAPARPREERQDGEPVPATVRAAQKGVEGAVALGDIWNDFADDAAAASRKHGERPRVRVRIDAIQKTSTGFMVTRTLTNDKGTDGTARFYFDSQEGQKLAGRTGEPIVVRGRVTSATPRIFMMFDCKLD